MQVSAKVIQDSIGAETNVRLLTMQLAYPRFIHSEFLTHRVFSRNSSSSRAIPIERVLRQVRENPALPIHWGKNKPGMQASEQIEGIDLVQAHYWWVRAAEEASRCAEKMQSYGLHKQVVNRVLEPFQLIHVVVTATEWQNFFDLRAHSDAQPEIRVLAEVMLDAMNKSAPVRRSVLQADASGWHLPYVKDEEREMYYRYPTYLAQLSAARCARVSYVNHDGSEPNEEKDIELFRRLVGGNPIHASPTEHQAFSWQGTKWVGNFRHWFQFRKMIEDGTFKL